MQAQPHKEGTNRKFDFPDFCPYKSGTYLPGHVLVDTYIDIASGASADKHPGFQRLVKDCRQKKIQYVITKSASRFARDIVDALEAIREIQTAGAKVYFEQENIDSDNPDMQALSLSTWQ